MNALWTPIVNTKENNNFKREMELNYHEPSKPSDKSETVHSLIYKHDDRPVLLALFTQHYI